MSWLRSLATGKLDVVEPSIVELAKASKAAPAPMSYAFDPSSMMWSWLGDRPTVNHPGTAGIDYGTLHRMSRIPVIGAMIQNRVNQIASFASTQRSRYGLGFEVVLKDTAKSPTEGEVKRAKEIEKLLLEAGGKHGPGGFEPFLRMITRDSLTYDQVNFEVMSSAGGRVSGNHKPSGFIPVDAATIRRAKPTLRELDKGRRDPDRSVYVQVVDDEIVNEYSYEEMAFGVRRPRTSLFVNGYGYPELEELINVITNLLNAETYNAVNFTNGVHASTILALKSRMDARAFTAFKRDIMSMMVGPRNAKRTPIIQLDPSREFGEDLKSISLGQSNRDMEYSSWVNWLLKISAAVFQIDPAEIGFVYGNEGSSSMLNQRGPEERIAHSMDKGFRPLIRAVQSWINHWIVEPLEPEFGFRFVGFDSLSEFHKVDLDVKRIRSYMTINEIRAEHDLPPLDGPTGDLILDGVYTSAITTLAFDEIGSMDASGDLYIPQADEVSPDTPSPRNPKQAQGQGEGTGTTYDQITLSLAAGIEEAMKSGRIVRKSGQLSPGKKWTLIVDDSDENDKSHGYTVGLDE